MVRDAAVRPAPTMRDVAQRAGVSQATVSYVISGRKQGDARISDETRTRVLQAMEELRYVPNNTARHLRRRRSDRICLVISRLGSPFGEALIAEVEKELMSFDKQIAEVERVAASHGFSLAIALGGSREREAAVFEQVRQRMADGLIVENAASSTSELQELASTGIPIVAMSNALEPRGFDVVSTSEPDAISDACRQLLQRGHRRIAVMGHATFPTSIDSRPIRILESLGAAGIETPPEYRLTGAESRKSAYAATQALLQLPNPPTALFSASDIGAISAIWAAQSLGRSVPDDLAIIGAGNIAEGEITWPSLSTIGAEHQPFAEIAELLTRRLTGDEQGEGVRMVIPWTFSHRGSS